MKHILSLVLLSICLGGVLNAVSAGSIKSVTPDPVVGSRAYTFNCITGDFDAVKTVNLYKGTAAADPTSFTLTAAKPADVDIVQTIDFKTTGELTMKVVTPEMEQTLKLNVLPTIIKSMTAKVKKDTDETVTLTTATGHTLTGNEKFQLATTAPTDTTTPAPLTCTKATDSKTTACQVNMKEGNYTLYMDKGSTELKLNVSSTYLKLAFGLLVSFFLF